MSGVVPLPPTICLSVVDRDNFYLGQCLRRCKVNNLVTGKIIEGCGRDLI
jgi:hypothetical protein